MHGPDAAIGVVADVGNHDALRALVASTLDAFGGLDVLINNAGVSMITSAFQDEDSFESNWATTLEVNLTAHARLIRELSTASPGAASAMGLPGHGSAAMR